MLGLGIDIIAKTRRTTLVCLLLFWRVGVDEICKREENETPFYFAQIVPLFLHLYVVISSFKLSYDCSSADVTVRLIFAYANLFSEICSPGWEGWMLVD